MSESSSLAKPSLSPKEIAPKSLAELDAMHTGSLMSRRRALLACPESSNLTAQDKASLLLPIRYKDSQVWKNAYQELKQVLATREHLPNKQERKAQRQARAKRKR
ncbi:hypothetical protein [Oceanisphaera avium]|uniref:Uncharacterized protein n=1 Tax=Oceanisphaera avium TaxID=1903694 RepID=A0A1Y0CWQ3_9GAMM|nr:hypothetical protein [Oceanisphaera avium]ART79771.1 hypothetical protein CBP12_06060 [Oceanisphaera avium]